jgi:hypothetical protein
MISKDADGGVVSIPLLKRSASDDRWPENNDDGSVHPEILLLRISGGWILIGMKAERTPLKRTTLFRNTMRLAIRSLAAVCTKAHR